MNIPTNLRYTKEHEWISVDGDVVSVGITEFAQGELGDIVYLDIESIGKTINQGEIFGTIEAVKTVSDLFMPATGIVLEKNSKLSDTPELVNKDPYGDGWLVKVKLSDPSQLNDLLTEEEYKKLITI